MTKQWKTSLSILLASLLILISLTACGGGGTAPAAEATDKGTGAAGTAEPQKEITLTWSFGKDASGVFAELAKMFEEKNPGIKINITELPSQSSTQHDSYVTKLSSKDTSVDLMSITWGPEFGLSVWLEPLNKYFTQEELDQFMPGPLASHSFNNELYAVPFFADAGMLYYRKDILDAAGVKPPQTFDELISLSEQLKGQGGTKYGFVFPGNSLGSALLEYIWGNGGDVVDADNKVVIDSPSNAEALGYFGKIVNSDFVPSGITTYAFDDARTLFTEGNVVFMRNWGYAWGKAQEEGSKVKGKVGIVPMPYGPSGQKPAAQLGGWGIGINAYISDEKKAAAVKFLKFLASKEGQAYTAIHSGRLPVLKSTFSDAEVLKVNPHFSFVYDVLMNAKPNPLPPIFGQIGDAMQIEVSKAVEGSQTNEAALKTLQKNISQIVDNFKY